MLFRSLAASQYVGFVTPEIRATSIQIQGQEASVTRLAERVGSSSVFSIPGLTVLAGRPVCISVSGQDAGQVGDFPQSPIITYRANGVQFAARRYYPVDRTRWFDLFLALNQLASGTIEITGPDAIYSWAVSDNSFPSPSRNAAGRYEFTSLPFSLNIGTRFNARISGFAYGAATQIRVRKTSSGPAIDVTGNIQSLTSTRDWKMELVHAYVPVTTGLVDLEVTVPGAWENLLVVARQ